MPIPAIILQHEKDQVMIFGKMKKDKLIDIAMILLLLAAIMLLSMVL